MRRFAAFACTLVMLVSCVPRMRVDLPRMRRIERIAPVTFVANRVVRPPLRMGDVAPPLPNDPTLTTAASIFKMGVPAFYEALRDGDRFEIVDSATILAASSYDAFPRLSGVNAGTAQLADGWRFVAPEDGRKIARLLDEVHADAALITYWRFTLESHTRGMGVDTAFPRAYMRAWLVDRDGTVIADDAFDVQADQLIAVYNQRYDGRVLAGLFSDPIETCAVRLIADLSNARTDARAAATPPAAPVPTPVVDAPPPDPATSPAPSPTATPTPPADAPPPLEPDPR